MNARDNVGLLQETETAGRAPKSLAELVAEHPFLAGMSAEHLTILTDCAMRAHFNMGDVIFREGDPANRFYLIRSGHVALESYVKDRPSVRIQTIGAGEVLGWSWLFAPYYWHFDARALEPTEAIFFYGTRLRELAEVNHSLGYELMKRMTGVVIQRLQATRRQLLAARPAA